MFCLKRGCVQHMVQDQSGSIKVKLKYPNSWITLKTLVSE